MTFARPLAFAAALLLALPAPTLANDSEAQVALGGLDLIRNAAISMDAEDLYISRDEVRVRYRYTNHSPHDVEVLVSFPVPDLPDGIGGYREDRAFPDFAALGFTTTVDGKPVALGHAESAMIGNRDVTRRIAELGWPLHWYRDFPDGGSFTETFTAAQKAAYLREGLLRRSAYDAAVLEPAWQVVTHVTRRQIFPAGRTIDVTHRYVPIAGGSVGGAFDRRNRRESYFTERAAKYCTDSAFLAAVDRRQMAAGGKDGSAFYAEHWVSYILRSGANWRGPIKDFRLVVDKGRADNLLSLCMTGVRKISPTQFEVRRTNFEPTQDIDLLILEWIRPE